ncbi:hypothetical protein [Methylibium sp.]|uniref:hypothetical protein n=1 Tax=Methylibium sp. TaxID=2067992 RepID=UPI0025EBCB27|nr:hypothetical protein [Methylibium sp.]
MHAHTALFGVYGMLGIGLVLFCLRGLKPDLVWNEGSVGALTLAWFVVGLWFRPQRRPVLQKAA